MASTELIGKIDEISRNSDSDGLLYKPAVSYPEPEYKQADMIAQYNEAVKLEWNDSDDEAASKAAKRRFQKTIREILEYRLKVYRQDKIKKVKTCKDLKNELNNLTDKYLKSEKGKLYNYPLILTI